jgi:hypothetical protein
MLLFFEVNMIMHQHKWMIFHCELTFPEVRCEALYRRVEFTHTPHGVCWFFYLWRCFHGRGCRQTFDEARSTWQDWKHLCFEMLARCAKTSWSQLATFPLAESVQRFVTSVWHQREVEMRKRNVQGRSGVAQLLYAAVKQSVGMILGHFTHNCGDISLKS